MSVKGESSDRLEDVPNCQCGDCRMRRREANIEGLRECIRVRTAERDESREQLEAQKAIIDTYGRRISVLERRNQALALEVEALECDVLAVRSEADARL
jgi:hypothetical protein